MVAVVIERDVDVEDVAVAERTLVWDAVADDFVKRCADRFWEVAVVEWGWICLCVVSAVIRFGKTVVG